MFLDVFFLNRTSSIADNILTFFVVAFQFFFQFLLDIVVLFFCLLAYSAILQLYCILGVMFFSRKRLKFYSCANMTFRGFFSDLFSSSFIKVRGTALSNSKSVMVTKNVINF